MAPAILIGIGLVTGGLGAAEPMSLTGEIPPDAPSDVRTQVDTLRSKSPFRRSRAARTLGEMGTRAAPAVPFLIELLDDGEVAKSFGDAVTALGAIQDWRAIEPLIEELKRTPPDPWAAEALFEITGERLDEDPQMWRAWWDQKNARYEASPT